MSLDRENSHPPLLIPDHDLIAKVGAGSYGEVWLARSLTGSFRAVKIIFRDRFKDARPFEREFQGILKFEPISRSHPGVIAILHVGQRAQEGYFYYVMEIADGLNVGQRIDPASYIPLTLASIISSKKSSSIDKCIDYGLALTAALKHLHQNGLAHRDIKPSNIIFVQGRPKLADIGMVTGIGGERSYLGTRGYIPPEGAGAPRADLYSLGKVLYEAASGNVAEKFPELPASLRENSRADLFFEFNEILLKACAPEPRRRYESAAQMHDDLQALKNGVSLRRANAGVNRLRRFQMLTATVAILTVLTATALAVKKRVLEEKNLADTQNSGHLKVPAIKVTTQPASGTVLKGAAVTLNFAATGDSLHYQWFRNSQPLPGETNPTLHINNFSPADVGRYHALISSGLGGKPATTESADWALGAQTQQKLLNIQFTARENAWHTPKQGPAAVGASNDDLWNFWSDEHSGLQNGGTPPPIGHLKWSDGTDSGATLSVTTDPGVTAKISNLPAQEFDIYVYAGGGLPNGKSQIELRINDWHSEKKTTAAKTGASKPGWTEDVDYVVFRNISIHPASELKIISRPDAAGVAALDAIQILKSPISLR